MLIADSQVGPPSSYPYRFPRREQLLFILLRSLLVISVLATGSLGLKAAPATAPDQNFRAVAPTSSFAIADFDGDLRPDLASVGPAPDFSGTSRYSIQFRFSTRAPQSIQLLAPAGGLGMEARDVNGDHAVDLILFTALFRQPIAIFLNDGHGKFLRAQPSAFPEALDRPGRTWDSNSLQDIAVVGAALQSRDEICPQAAGLPHGQTETKKICVPNLHVGRNLFVTCPAGRAPPIEIQSI
jgi:hypothetical protein